MRHETSARSTPVSMHAADTSLSVEQAVDVAREAADFVLLGVFRTSPDMLRTSWFVKSLLTERV